ncbi:hypothetical protein [Algoriphagus confluentis]|uniref:Uncharacterized protein n=1 Tax=Algoriphagus confluentis TaxID=1697556 RepID=A0ABQ6PV83_9BACT|nr:hypothetical protein Aconfl_37610 [Algoriphagus confluentis]
MAGIACLIGEAMLSFSNAEFLLDNLFRKIGLTKKKFDYMAISSTGQKIKEYKAKLIESELDVAPRIAYLIEEVDSFRELRNVLAHSIILSNSSGEQEFMTHKFYKTKEGISRYTAVFTASHLSIQIQEFREVCQSLNEILKELD